MSDVSDPRRWVDPAINEPGREGLTGTASADLYAPSHVREQITIAPDLNKADEQPAWRQDFPIDWPQDQYVERRDFMKFLVLTSAAFSRAVLDRRTELAAQAARATGDAADRVGGRFAVGELHCVSASREFENCLLVRLTRANWSPLARNARTCHVR